MRFKSWREEAAKPGGRRQALAHAREGRGDPLLWGKKAGMALLLGKEGPRAQVFCSPSLAVTGLVLRNHEEGAG